MTDHERNSNTLKTCRMSSTEQEKYEESKFSKITGKRGRGQNAANRKKKTDGKRVKRTECSLCPFPPYHAKDPLTPHSDQQQRAHSPGPQHVIGQKQQCSYSRP